MHRLFAKDYEGKLRDFYNVFKITINLNWIQDELRVKRTVYDTEVGQKFGGQALWHHLNCFAQVRGDYDFYVGGENLPGFGDLSKEDKKQVKESLPAIKVDEEQIKKMKHEPLNEAEKAANKELEDTIAKQTKMLFIIRDELEKSCSKGDLQNILFTNKSCIVEGKDRLLDRCADFLTFGALAKCQKCQKGDLIFSKYGYTCNGMISEWAQCSNFIDKPLRMKCKIPDNLKKSETSKFFSKYKPKVQDRAVRPTPKNVPGVIPKVEAGSEVREAKVKREKLPLYGMHFVPIGNLSMQRSEMKTRIEKMGGKLVTKIQSMTAAVISTKEEVAKMNKRMQEVQDLDIHVVPESFIDAVKSCSQSDAIEKIKSTAICDWGSDPLLRIPQEETTGPKESMYTKNAQKKTNIKLKNGSAVDPESGLDDVAHVYKENNVLYTSTLGLTDIQRNKNSFYKLQVLQSDAGRDYWIFRSWGRIGTKVGNTKLEKCSSAQEACSQFEELYMEKSGNMWNSGMPFQKRAGLYYPIDVDYDDDDKAKKIAEKSSIPSKLPKPVQELVKMLFDIDSMKQTMLEFELDLEKMPLGRLSRKQLHEAYEVLTELSDLVARGGNDSEFIACSNKFFTLVPHSFGINRAPIIDNLNMIQSKREMIDNLMEIEIAYSMLKTDTDDKLNPVDCHYEQLKTDMEPLDHKSEEFQLIQQYVVNTHAATHNQYSLEVVDIFKVERKGEKRRYKPFKKLHNRQLLWHGSRLTNYVGILSHGLKIAPPEAPVTGKKYLSDHSDINQFFLYLGYMFGKGIYFADMVSKSANYCFTNPQHNTGLMLLSEVALGDYHELTRATYINKLPDGKHSVKGIGKTAPDPSMAHTCEDGVIIPLGKGITNDKLRSELLYNEFIVYDVAQVQIQYLLKVKFNYKK